MNMLDLAALSYCPMTLFRFVGGKRYDENSSHARVIPHAIESTRWTWISPYALVQDNQWSDLDRAFMASVYHTPAYDV